MNNDNNDNGWGNAWNNRNNWSGAGRDSEGSVHGEQILIMLLLMLLLVLLMIITQRMLAV